jgi:hypothetical protein
MAWGMESKQESAAPHHASISTTMVVTSVCERRFEVMAAALEIPCRFVGGELGEITTRWLADQESQGGRR